MLRDLLSDIVRRRLWPIPLLALGVAIAAPLLFLKSAPEGAPTAATPAPAATAAGDLPARAQRLLATSDGGSGSGSAARARASGAKHDPFAPPAGHVPVKADRAKSAATSSKSSDAKSGSPAAASTTPAKPVPVVITNGDGSVPATGTTVPPISGDATPALTASSAAVDVRFGERRDSPLRREIPRLQSFVAGGGIVAIFVKYSPKRDKAVFAIAPGTVVSGDVECRRKEGVCRYVDIPAGEYVRLTWRATDGTVMSRRLDVVHIGRSSSSGADVKAASSTSAAVAKCRLGRILRLAPGQQVAVNDCDE